MSKILGILFTAVVLASCVRETCADCDFDPLVPASADRVYFHYMATDNNLSSFGDRNIDLMQVGMKDVEGNGVVIVFRDVPGNVSSQLLIIFNDTRGKAQKRVLKTYDDNLDATDPRVFKQALSDAQKAVRSDEWVFGFGSHGVGWVPWDMFNIGYGSRSAKYMGQGPMTRVLIEDDHLGQKVMEIDEFADMLPDGGAEFMLMDLCLMGGVEFAYELKDKADYLVMSPAEVLAAGFPYDKIMDDIFADNVRTAAGGVCTEYHKHYLANQTFGTVALIDCSKMDAFAQAMIGVWANAPMSADVSGVLCYDRFARPMTFDMGAFITLLGGDSNIMDALVPPEFALTTGKPLGEAPNELIIPQARYSGLSTYIPVAGYADLNVEYRKTAWYQALAAGENARNLSFR